MIRLKLHLQIVITKFRTFYADFGDGPPLAYMVSFNHRVRTWKSVRAEEYYNRTAEALRFRGALTTMENIYLDLFQCTQTKIGKQFGLVMRTGLSVHTEIPAAQTSVLKRTNILRDTHRKLNHLFISLLNSSMQSRPSMVLFISRATQGGHGLL
jgi:hypothetical protein